MKDPQIEVRFPAGARYCLFFTASTHSLGTTQPHIQWVSGGKRPERETDYYCPGLECVELYLRYTSQAILTETEDCTF
jgi:hypothetical protein